MSRIKHGDNITLIQVFEVYEVQNPEQCVENKTFRKKATRKIVYANSLFSMRIVT